MSENLLIRTDASVEIGIGHVMRMLALSQAWLKTGGQVVFATVGCPLSLQERLNSEGIEVREIDAPIGSQRDCESTIQIANEINSSWLILDGYRFDSLFQRKAKESKSRLLCVDDYGQCECWWADLMLNQNLFADQIEYSGLGEAKVLRGPAYALLRNELIAQPLPVRSDDRTENHRILITLGGGDPENNTQKVLAILNKFPIPKLSIRGLVGNSNPHGEALRVDCERSPHDVCLLSNVADMHEQYTWADKIICAAGSTCLEWLYYRLPAAIVAVAENQKLNRHSLTKHRLAVDLGWHQDGIDDEALEAFIRQPSPSREKFPQIVDGRGAARVVNAMQESV